MPAARPRIRRKGRGVLATIGALLLASAVVRIVAGAGEAIALEEAQDNVGITGAEPVAQATLDPKSLKPLLDALTAREDRVAEREEALAIRMQALSRAEREIDNKLAELKAAEDGLRETLALANEAAENDIGRLTDVYANMKPKQAAALFSEMAPEFAAGFLARMRPDAAASIMAGLDPRTAYTISVILAGRNADVPTE